MCITDQSLVSQIMDTPVTDSQVGVERHKEDYGPINIHAIWFSGPVSGIHQKVMSGTYNADDNFSRVLKVASCISLCKTSTSDSESGVLDMLYG